MHVYCEALGSKVSLPDRPERIVSLVSSFTEAAFAMGQGERVVGVSEYCRRYVDGLEAPVVGDYLKVDDEALAAVEPDLLLCTTGIQLPFAKKLLERGLPVFALPVPSSMHAIQHNHRLLGGLFDSLPAANALIARIDRELHALLGRDHHRPRVFVDLWFGRHRRSPGGLSFISDLVRIAGGEPIFADRPTGYFQATDDEIVAARPGVYLGFDEPEVPIDFAAKQAELGLEHLPLIHSTVDRGRNLIHDGPSIVETAHWLHDKLAALDEDLT